jgi:hypothetical protein
MAHRIALGLLDGRLVTEASELDHTQKWPSFPRTLCNLSSRHSTRQLFERLCTAGWPALHFRKVAKVVG